jgi:hypothetical protein
MRTETTRPESSRTAHRRASQGESGKRARNFLSRHKKTCQEVSEISCARRAPYSVQTELRADTNCLPTSTLISNRWSGKSLRCTRSTSTELPGWRRCGGSRVEDYAPIASALHRTRWKPCRIPRPGFRTRRPGSRTPHPAPRILHPGLITLSTHLPQASSHPAQTSQSTATRAWT